MSGRSPSTMRRATLAVALLLVSPLAAAPALHPQDEPRPARRTLEELRAEARAERERRQAALLPQVAEAVAALDALERRRREERADGWIRTLVGLGPDVAPLLVQYIDPGDTASRAQLYRAECVTRALRELASVSVTDPLLQLARTGTLAGRLNALEALSAAPDGDRVAPVLAELSRAPTGGEGGVPQAVKMAALASLARVGGPTAEQILAGTLASTDRDLVGSALEALALVQLRTAAPQVLELARSTRGAGLAREIATYLDAVPDAFAEDDAVDDIVALLLRDTVSREGRVALLDVLRLRDQRPPAGAKRELGELAEGLDGVVRRATLLYLASQRDRGARRELLEPYDAQIKDGRNLDRAHEARAETLHAIGDHQAAARDWREALKIQSEQGGVRSADPYLGLARTLAALGRFKEAAEYLEQAPVSMSVLHALAAEREFAEMLGTRYRSAFHLPDDEDTGR